MMRTLVFRFRPRTFTTLHRGFSTVPPSRPPGSLPSTQQGFENEFVSTPRPAKINVQEKRTPVVIWRYGKTIPHNNQRTVCIVPDGDADSLCDKLKSTPGKGVNYMIIEHQLPSPEEWAIIERKFPSVRTLTIRTQTLGMKINDETLALPWPVETLVIQGVKMGELQIGPYSQDLLGGKVRQLILADCGGMSFGHAAEGKQATVKVFEEQSSLRMLTIVNNGACDTLLRMYATLPHVVKSLRVLTLRAPTPQEDIDRGWINLHPEQANHHIHRKLPAMDKDSPRMGLTHVFPRLFKLRTLNLTIGGRLEFPARVDDLYKFLPPNITLLRFRGPAWLAESQQMNKWIKAFGYDEYLPRLQKLVFVLDQDHVHGAFAAETFRKAWVVCMLLRQEALKRDIKVHTFHPRWEDHCFFTGFQNHLRNWPQGSTD
ncbi:hypothetical protein BDW74DRAFT_179208 [Aspergillus multicolor]|uniref:uncharacterized protein n=1 Tax=Aspergillus multicolor TaxID=41759 RepID=UPI003CCCB7D6